LREATKFTAPQTTPGHIEALMLTKCLQHFKILGNLEDRIDTTTSTTKILPDGYVKEVIINCEDAMVLNGEPRFMYTAVKTHHEVFQANVSLISTRLQYLLRLLALPDNIFCEELEQRETNMPAIDNGSERGIRGIWRCSRELGFCVWQCDCLHEKKEGSQHDHDLNHGRLFIHHNADDPGT
jgi:hypothetical protein